MVGRLGREELRSYLNNYPLIQTIELKAEIDATRKNICKAEETLTEIKVSDLTLEEIVKKREEYKKISQAYGRLLSDVWGIAWQTEQLISKYLNYDEEDIDELPEYVELT